MSDTCLVGGGTGEQAGPGRAASAGIVELSEPQAVLGESVEIGSLDLASIASNIRPAHIVRHYDNDIRAALPAGKTRHEKNKAEKDGKSHK